MLSMLLRRDQIADALQRGDPRLIAQKVGQLFIRFPATRVPESQMAATIAAYTADLSGFPMWIIDAACKQVIEGHAGLSASFAPSSAELRCVCERIADPLLRERADLSAVIGAEVVVEQTPEVRAKVLQEFAALQAELQSGKPDPRAAIEEGELRLAEWRESPRAPMFSPLLRKKLGLPEQEATDDFEF